MHSKAPGGSSQATAAEFQGPNSAGAPITLHPFLFRSKESHFMSHKEIKRALH